MDTRSDIAHFQVSDEHQRKFISTEGIILGVIIGGLMIALAVMKWRQGQELVEAAIGQTMVIAVYLTIVVAHAGFKMPTFFANSAPRLAAFMLAFLCGHVSLFFDSFAVVLLLSTLAFMPFPGARYQHAFNAFAFKAICAFNALTVGGGFWVGELWGVPYFVSSGMTDPVAGLPLLIVATPYCALTSLIAAFMFPVKMEKAPFDTKQVKACAYFIAFLLLLLLTHRPVFCLGVLLIVSALTGKTVKMVADTLHELGTGAISALGLIGAAMLTQAIPGATEWFAQHLQGGWVFLGASISSPFAGAMLEGANGNLEIFYQNLSLLMLGAPMFVWSSLVAIVVFKESISYEDLPRWLTPFASEKKGLMQEAVAYTALVVPLNAGLAALLYAGNASGIFVAAYKALEPLVH